MPTRMRASRRWPRSPSRAPLVALNRSSPIVARLPNITHSIMANKRPLLPAVQSLPNAPRSLGAEPVDDDGGPPTQQPPTSKRQRHRHSAQEWAQQRELFTILYHRNGDSLENAIKLIEEERGFKASVRLWKEKIKEWNLSKNLSNKDMNILVAKRKERQSAQRPGTRFLWGDVEIKNNRLDRFEKRTGVDTEDRASPSMPTPDGVVYDTPHSIISGESPFDASNKVFLSQDEHHFQSIQPVTIINVQRVHSQLCFRCTLTSQDRPRESPDYITLVRDKKNLPLDVLHFDSDSPFDGPGPGTPANQSTGKPPKRAGTGFILQKPTHQVCWKCHKSRHIKISKHRHRMGHQGIAYRGREITDEKPTQLLWQARNLALDLCGTFRQKVGRESPGQYSSQDTSAPEVWASAQAIDNIGPARFQRLLNFVKHSAFFTSLLSPCHRDQQFWVGSWRLMADLHGSEIETLALGLFGDPSVPYPEMNLFTFIIRFNLSSPTRKLLLRLVLGTESQAEIFNCEVCASDFMILDSIDQETAVKIHIPLTRTKNPLRCNGWRDFSTNFETKTCHENRRWSEIRYIHQGWTELSLLRNVKDKNIVDHFDENGPPAHIKQFQPFQDDSEWDCFSGAMIGSGLREDPDSNSDVWDPTGSESDDQFDPFLKEHSRKVEEILVRDEW